MDRAIKPAMFSTTWMHSTWPVFNIIQYIVSQNRVIFITGLSSTPWSIFGKQNANSHWSNMNSKKKTVSSSFYPRPDKQDNLSKSDWPLLLKTHCDILPVHLFYSRSNTYIHLPSFTMCRTQPYSYTSIINKKNGNLDLNFYISNSTWVTQARYYWHIDFAAC